MKYKRKSLRSSQIKKKKEKTHRFIVLAVLFIIGLSIIIASILAQRSQDIRSRSEEYIPLQPQPTFIPKHSLQLGELVMISTTPIPITSPTPFVNPTINPIGSCDNPLRAISVWYVDGEFPSTTTINYNNPQASCKLLLLVSISSSSPVQSVTFNGVKLTKVGSVDIDDKNSGQTACRESIWALYDAPVGTHDVKISFSEPASGTSIRIITIAGTEGSNLSVNAVTDKGEGVNASIHVPSNSNQIIFNAVSSVYSIFTPDIYEEITWPLNPHPQKPPSLYKMKKCELGGLLKKAVSGSTDIGWQRTDTIDEHNEWGAVAIPLNPAL